MPGNFRDLSKVPRPPCHAPQYDRVALVWGGGVWGGVGGGVVAASPDGRGFPCCKTISYLIAKESCADSKLMTRTSGSGTC